MTQYYYADSTNQPVGPVSREDLDGLAATGKVTTTTHIIEVGADEWITYAELKDKATQYQAPLEGTSKDDTVTKEIISSVAVEISKMVEVTTSEFDTTARVSFPKCIGGGLFSNTSAAFTLGFLKEALNLRARLPLITMLSIVIKNENIINWNTAHGEGGQEFEVKHLDTSNISNESWLESLNVTIPLDFLYEKRNSGMKVRISRPDKGAQEILTIPPEHIQAVFYYLRPDSFEVQDRGGSEGQDGDLGFVAKQLRKVPNALLLPISIFCGVLGLISLIIFLSDHAASNFIFNSVFGFAIAYFVYQEKNRRDNTTNDQR